MPCSPALSDGTCEAACACRIMRVRHSSVNSEVVSGTGVAEAKKVSPTPHATQGRNIRSPIAFSTPWGRPGA